MAVATDAPMNTRVWRSYVAVGDSFTEGMCDDDGATPGEYRGWADRLAEALAHRAARAGQDFRYANLAVRGRLLNDIAGPQLDRALALQPELVSIVGGGNDILRPRADVDALLAQLEAAVARTRATGADVLMSTAADPVRSPLIRLTRGRCGIFTAGLWSIARKHGCFLVDLWSLAPLQSWQAWADDRIHLTTVGHRVVAAAALNALALDTSDAEEAVVAKDEPMTFVERLQWNARWGREYVRPWVRRRLARQSSGDGRQAKRPELDAWPPGRD
jgi:lysophospholipase L1-like esterase